MTQTDTAQIAKRVLNLIILDESGSMTGLEKTSVTGVNETIQTIRSSYDQKPDQEQLLTLVTFSTRGDSFFRVKFDKEPIANVKELNIADYTPGGVTPLYDTMGKALTELERTVTDTDIVLVTIITDGYENASREYDVKAIKRLIGRLSEKNWVFTYIGANQDAVLEAGQMGICNAMNYVSDEQGTGAMWEKERAYRACFMKKVQDGCSIDEIKESYFADGDIK